MTPKQIEIVQASFDKVAPIAEAAAGLFYARLFELAPTTRALFLDDLSSQRDKLKHMLVMLMRGLDRPVELAPALAALGDRHRSYGVVKTDFAVVGLALIDTLAKHLGDAFTDADRGAWVALYRHVTNIMLAGTRRSAEAA